MALIAIEITRYVDDDFPGLVECILLDAFSSPHVFVEKAPVVSNKDLHRGSIYPQPGVMACAIESDWLDEQGRHLLMIDTERPWGIASIAGETRFVVLSSCLIQP